jgi:hypothetical protein
MYHKVSASIARVWHVLCSEYPFYPVYYWQIDWPSTLRYRITSKYSTDTFIEQVQTGTIHRFFWKASQKANCLSVYYANEQSDRLLYRPLSDKALPHVTYSQAIQRQGQPILFVRQQTWSEKWHIWVGIVKLSIVRGRTSKNWSNTTLSFDETSAFMPTVAV